MTKVTGTLIGAEEVKRQLSLVDLRIAAQARRVVNSIALEIMNDARELAPADRRRLGSSIRTTFYANGLTAEVGTNVEYAQFVEFGTGPAGRASNQQPLPAGYFHGNGGKFPPLEVIRDWCKRHGLPASMAYPIARKIAERGLPARPFLYPALENHRQEFERDFAAALRGML